MQSQWTEPVAFDENELIWPEVPQYFDEDSRLRVSLMNDDRYLYIQLLTRSQMSKMLFLRAGFTLWLDDTGNTEKRFGLLFPLPRQKQIPGSMSDHRSRNSMEDMLEDSQYSMAILKGAEATTRQTLSMSKAAEMGIYARLGIQRGYLVYELKVPLTGSADGNIIGVGFESGEMERPASRGSSGGGRGGKGGGGKGGGKKMGGQKGGPGEKAPQPIEIWARVHLAEHGPSMVETEGNRTGGNL